MSRAYHHGNLRVALIEAGVGLARTGGPDAVVLREVARLTGVSHNAAYRHFSDRQELLAEVAAVGMGELEQAMLTGIAAVRTRDPRLRARRRLREVGRAYVEFALGNPGLFEVAFSTEPLEGAGPGPYGVLNDVLDELAAVGAMPRARRTGAEVTCWAAVHGFAVLHLHGPLREASPEERAAALDPVLDTVDRGLTAA